MNLPESNTWEPVRQWETTDPALGGPNTLFTQPIQNLTNRTKYLKGLLDAADVWKTTTTAWMAAIDAWQIQVNKFITDTGIWKGTIDAWKTTAENWRSATTTTLANTATWQAAVNIANTATESWKTTIDGWKTATASTLSSITSWQGSVGSILEDIQETWRPDVDYFISTTNTWKQGINTTMANLGIWQNTINAWKVTIGDWKTTIDTWKGTIDTWKTSATESIASLTATQGKRLASGTYTMTETADHVLVTILLSPALPNNNYMVFLSAGTTLSNDTYIVGTTFMKTKSTGQFQFILKSDGAFQPCNGRYVDWVIFAK